MFEGCRVQFVGRHVNDARPLTAWANEALTSSFGFVAAHDAGRFQAELIRLGRYPLLVVDEVGHIPFEPEAANLLFQLVSSRYERASLIVASNKVGGFEGPSQQ